MTDDARLYAPAVARNRGPILQALQPHLPPTGRVLEIASGTGEHIVYFAQHCGGGLSFQPSDPDGQARASIDRWVISLGLANVEPALTLDAVEPRWPVANADVIICINMIHIAPWAATVGLMSGAQRVLPKDGVLFLYGPFLRNGAHTSTSNEAFDADLRARDASWGVRDLETVAALAAAHGFEPPVIEPMPANNLAIVFQRTD